MYMVKNIYDDSFATSIVEEILIHGYLEMSSVILKVLCKYFKEKRSDLAENEVQLQINEQFVLIKDSFKKLVGDGILERLPGLEIENNSNETNLIKIHKIPKYIALNEFFKQDVPDIKIPGK
jgi:hypothetical protein